jgi:hypothetical protein
MRLCGLGECVVGRTVLTGRGGHVLEGVALQEEGVAIVFEATIASVATAIRFRIRWWCRWGKPWKPWKPCKPCKRSMHVKLIDTSSLAACCHFHILRAETTVCTSLAW